jgi:hypothetical protein
MDGLDDDAAPEVVLHFDVDEPVVQQAEGLVAMRRNIGVQERELQAATADAVRRAWVGYCGRVSGRLNRWRQNGGAEDDHARPSLVEDVCDVDHWTI